MQRFAKKTCWKSMPYNNYINKYMKVSSLSVNAQNVLQSQILHYTTFKQIWSDGGGIWSHPGGIYTQGFINRKVSIFYAKNGSVAVFVEDSLAYIIQYPNDKFPEDVRNKNMEFVYLAKDKYERTEYNLGNMPL
jgi:hypothetical protein